MTYDEYILAACTRVRKQVDKGDRERVGQAFFNALYEIRPALADHFRGENLDPFYDDAALPDFLEELHQNW